MRSRGALYGRYLIRSFYLLLVTTLPACLDETASPVVISSENETISLSAPTDFVTSAITTTGFTLSWTAVEADPTGYQVEICLTSGCTAFARLTLTDLTAASTSYAFSELIPGFIYRVRLRAYDSTGVSEWLTSSDIATLGPPNTPTALVASSVVATTLTLGWSDNSSDEANFTIQSCTGAGCTSFTTDVATPAADATSSALTGLVAGTTYRFRVRAENEYGNSAWVLSDDVTTYTVPTNASAVTAVPATLQSTSLVLGWTDNSSNETGFTIKRCTAALCTPSVTIATAAADATSYSDTGLTAGTTYVYKVIATNPAGDSAAPPTLEVTTTSTPVTPGGTLAASSTTTTTAVLTWTDPADPTNEAAYEVSYSSDAGTSWTVFSTAIAADAAGTTVTGLTTGTGYLFRVRRRFTNADTSAWLTSSTIYTLGVPVVPSTVTVLETSYTTDGTSGQARVVWRDDYDSAVTAIAPTSYTIAACTSTTSCATKTHSSTVPEFVFNGLTPGTNYFFKVRGINVTGSSSWSEASITATPGNLTTTLRTDGTVYSMLQSGNRVLVAGDFNLVGHDYGRGILLEQNTPSSSPWSSTAQYAVNGTVYASAQDSSGYTYIGGEFTKVGSSTKQYLARLTPTGELDTTFTTVTNGAVYSLALSSDGERLFVGGNFTSVTAAVGGGTTQYFFALVVSTQTAYEMVTVNAVDPAQVHTIDGVGAATSTLIPYSIAYVSESGSLDTLVLGGTGTVVAGGTTLTGLAKVVFSQAAFTYLTKPLWCAATLVGGSQTINALSLASSSALLVGGNFSSACGSVRNNFLVLDPSDATGTVSSVNPNPNGQIRAIAVGPSQVYLGGDFTTLYATAADYIGSITLTGGSGAGTLVSTWTTEADAAVHSLAVSGSYVWAGGNFTTIGGSTRYRLAKLLGTTGAVADYSVALSGIAHTVSNVSGYLFVGGEFEISNGSARNNLAWIDSSSGEVQSLSLTFDAPIRTMTIADQMLYVGGTFTTVGSSARAKIAAIDLSDGTLDDWDPSPTDPLDIAEVLTLRLSHRRTSLFVGGNFEVLGSNDNTTQHIGILNLSTGEADSSFDVSGFGVAEKVYDLLPLATRLIAVGDFQNHGASTRDGLVAFSLVSGGTYGVLDAAWDPDPENGSLFYSVESSFDRTLVYVGGKSADIGGTAGEDLYTLAAADGAAVSVVFSGSLLNPATDSIRVVRRSSSQATSSSTTPTDTLIIGGELSGVPYIQELAVAAPGVGLNTTPLVAPSGTYVYSVLPSGQRVAVGGTFSSFGSTTLLNANFAVLERSIGGNFQLVP